MSDAQPLFDPAALSAHRARASAIDADQWFLHGIAASQVQERLSEVNRSFTSPAIVGWRAQDWAGQLGFDATCVPDTEILDLQPGAHDLVIHALGLHWSNDPVGQLIQMRRALQPDGLMIAVLLAGETLAELRHALTRAEADLTGGIRPRVAPMGELRALGGLLQRAGFALPVADSEPVPVSYQSAFHLMRELRAMGETSALSARPRGMTRRSVIMRAAELMPQGADGRVHTRFELAFLTGWAPSETQQKPLRPGSAITRLADALGVDEHKQK